METQTLLLDKLQLLFILIETGFLGWTMLNTLKRTKENRPQQFLSTKLLVISCGILFLLYAVDFFLYTPTAIIAFCAFLWLACTIMWIKSLGRLSKLHKIEDDIEDMENEIRELVNKHDHE